MLAETKTRACTIHDIVSWAWLTQLQRMSASPCHRSIVPQGKLYRSGSPLRLTAMVKKVINPIVPKKGKPRKVQKRPASNKSKLWKSIRYIREGAAASSRQRKDQIKWKRTLSQLLKASSSEIIDTLIADKFLPKWEGKSCPTCSKGTLSKLQVDPRGGRLKHRCSYRKCHVWMNPHHLHPLFTAGQGPQAQSLQMQAAHILLKLHRIPQSKIHLLLDISHKAIEDMEKKICKMRQEYVEQKEKKILLGNGQSSKDVEADEATCEKRDISQSVDYRHLMVSKNSVIPWEQWAGIIQRGRPETLILRKLQPKITVKRAPGPGATRKIEWKVLANELLLDRR